ncbi:glycosyltransferase family 2 protein [Pseudoroseomonas cervicalis]|uniref:glycosyltransferase family 2 protein n=1 Tax=Teichococcus cervicalis TaxID=204525 RepID=UPI002787058E|nr:glycosyltransferase family 2 protein [Pseudoroseomonas cervicalis]MDQ1080832.1 glycosyltransferase involved in cell wall biosynthesis [Pseudoroseomonas cervicalis]
MTETLPKLVTSPAWHGATPRLSILVPTYDRDIRPLAAELLADMAALPEPGTVELLVLIDGNPALTGQEKILEAAAQRGQAAGLANAQKNLGRAGARNALARLARGQVVLFLDADGLPDSPGFVGRALAAAEAHPRDVVCGGRSGQRLPPVPADSLLFHTHSQKREWLPAETRNRDPAGNFLSANFQIDRDLFLATPFDDRFRGWGWEDTEWALRIGAQAPVRHVDNSVTHMEFHRDADWLGRLDRSVENYRLLFEAHPEAVRRHRIFPMIRALRPVGRWRWLRGLLWQLALWRALPPSLRLQIAKLRQAMVYGAILEPQTSP